MTQSNSSKKIKSSILNINKTNAKVNRGVELILNGGKKKPRKSFHIIFNKIICFLNREVSINFEFSLDIRNINKNSKGGNKWP